MMRLRPQKQTAFTELPSPGSAPPNTRRFAVKALAALGVVGVVAVSGVAYFRQHRNSGSSASLSRAHFVALAESCVDDWAQCGGETWTGPTCCSGDGSFCSAQSQWYSQCLPAGSTPFPYTPAPTSAGCVNDWGQCGGKNYKGPTCCSGAGSFCSVQDDWYSQCLPAGSTPIPTKSPKLMKKSNEECVDDWAQCGGESWTGPTCCSGDGSFCSPQSRWYSQCLPAGSTPFPYSLPPITPGCVDDWGQCGGKEYKGATCCKVGGSFCSAQSIWYSQCLPAGSTPFPTSTPSDTCVDDWGQCGGKLYKGPNCCSGDGSFCSKQSVWYSQCLPAGSTPFPTVSPKAASSNDDCVDDWGQCGGKLYQGPTCCSVEGSFCSQQSVWYSQCLPAGSTPFPTSTPAPTCVDDWGQCGGKLYTGPTCCSGEGSFCSNQSVWYSQCLPAGSTPFPTVSPKAARSNDDCVDDWGQCGGKLYQGPTCCSGEGSFCSQQSVWYSQCLPAGSTPFPTVSPKAARSNADCVADWGQCGGKLYQGPTCCSEEGSFCSAQSEWYSQCLPIGTTPFPYTPAPTSSGCVDDWGQCGGKAYQGPTCCAVAGSFCSQQSVWYSQCLPVGTTPFPTVTAAPVCVPDWGQCGGKLYQGPTCCSEDGSFCSQQSVWYSQCLPAGSTPFPTTSPKRTIII